MINVKFPFIRKFVRKGCRQLFLKLGRTNHLYNFLYPTSIVFSLKKWLILLVTYGKNRMVFFVLR